ncbi:MAG: LysM domain-containing protein [Verrucomicrobia bacterium]|nr:MAG: LysM domain-containing protein [Verrucomicrobiota bacterium]
MGKASSSMGLLAALALLLAAGCSGPPEGDGEDVALLQEAERVLDIDPRRAIELLELALEKNPRLAEAHRLLGSLWAQTTTNNVEAIYHFQKFLALAGKPNRWEATVRSRIDACRQRLVQEELLRLTGAASLRPIQRLQVQLDDARRSNEVLRATVLALQAQLAEATNLLAQAGLAGRGPAASAAADRRATPTPATAGAARGARPAPAAGGSRAEPPAAATHRVRRGETLIGIGRMYGFSLAEMKAANPGIDHDRLQVGQVIRLPRPVR